MAVNQDEPKLVYTTWPDADSAEQAGAKLVVARLAACVNILPEAISVYEWQGTLQRNFERPMLIKTTAARLDEIMRMIRELHPYDVPAIEVLDVTDGEPEFLKWVSMQTAAGDD